jgi:heavy metal translocating P-type ATPase
VGKGAREGILVKDAATLEKLHKVNVLVVDKTGTITKGKPELVSFKNMSEKSDDEVFALLASLEKKSEHPIAYALVTYAETKNLTLKSVSDFDSIKGKGLQGVVEGKEYFVGSPKFAEESGLAVELSIENGQTPVVIFTNEKVLGIAYIADAIKPEAKIAIANLHKLGVRIIMITGDAKKTAEYIAKEAGVDEVIAEAMPEVKLEKIKSLQAQGFIVAMAGDGVNDAPALAQADVGIAMATGTDVAIESAGITLLHGDISKLEKAFKLSKITMRGIKQNLFWAFAYNVIGIPLAAGLFYPVFGWLLNPVFAGGAMALSSVSVVGNSLRIKSMKL